MYAVIPSDLSLCMKSSPCVNDPCLFFDEGYEVTFEVASAPVKRGPRKDQIGNHIDSNVKDDAQGPVLPVLDDSQKTFHISGVVHHAHMKSSTRQSHRTAEPLKVLRAVKEEAVFLGELPCIEGFLTPKLQGLPCQRLKR